MVLHASDEHDEVLRLAAEAVVVAGERGMVAKSSCGGKPYVCGSGISFEAQ
jgi:hypothetical protein